MIGRLIFLTGVQRSGTTLLQKLIDMQRSLAMLAQPFPLLFVEVKRAFLSALGVDYAAFPLNHLFRETRYDREQFATFLTRWRAADADLLATFRRMENYSGQYTRFGPEALEEALGRIKGTDDFALVLTSLLHAFTGSADVKWFGSKETSAEEYVPYLLDRGARCAIIIRDPRDVVTSLNHGSGRLFGGEIKPTLFNIRSWRKSVATAMAMQGRRHFHWCRYEDLVSDPEDEMRRLAAALEVDLTGDLQLQGDILDSMGQPWRGNSSHGDYDGVGRDSIGRYRDLLPEETACFIEATTLPELQLLGYEATLSHRAAFDVIEKFREPPPIGRDGLAIDWTSSANAKLEQERLERIATAPDADSPSWFLFAATHSRLREAFR